MTKLGWDKEETVTLNNMILGTEAFGALIQEHTPSF